MARVDQHVDQHVVDLVVLDRVEEADEVEECQLRSCQHNTPRRPKMTSAIPPVSCLPLVSPPLDLSSPMSRPLVSCPLFLDLILASFILSSLVLPSLALDVSHPLALSPASSGAPTACAHET